MSGIKVADAQGAIDTSVSRIVIADAQGNIDKEIQNGYVADTHGDIDKQFYANWKYYTSTILNSSAGGGKLRLNQSRTFSPYISYIVRPVTLLFDFSATRASVTIEDTVIYSSSGTLRLKIEHSLDGVNWTALTTKNVSVTTTYYYPCDTTFTMNGITDVKYLRYNIKNITSSELELGTISVKCTAYYKKG